MLRRLKKNRHNPDYKQERKRLKEFVINMTAKGREDFDAEKERSRMYTKIKPNSAVGKAGKAVPEPGNG